MPSLAMALGSISIGAITHHPAMPSTAIATMASEIFQGVFKVLATIRGRGMDSTGQCAFPTPGFVSFRLAAPGDQAYRPNVARWKPWPNETALPGWKP